MKKNYNWAKATLVMGCMLGLGWLATPVMARDMDVRLMDEDTTIMVVAEVQPEFNGNGSGKMYSIRKRHMPIKLTGGYLLLS